MQVGLLNVDGYYNSLLSFIDKAVDEGFIAPSARQIILSAQTAHELMSKLEVQLAYAPSTTTLISLCPNSTHGSHIVPLQLLIYVKTII